MIAKPRRSLGSVLMLALFCSVMSQALPPAQDVSTAQPESLIKLRVLVTDADGRPVANLKQEDFNIVEEGSPQAITYFSKAELPITYCLVVDTSGSQKKALGQVVDAAQKIVSNNKSGDETSLIEFKDVPELLSEFTSRKEQTLRDLDSLRRGASGRSGVIDAVFLAVKHVAEYKPGDRSSRRALVVISDGEDRGSYYKPSDLLKVLRKENVQVFAIGYDMNELRKTRGENAERRAVDLLRLMTLETGGEAFFLRSRAELGPVVDGLLDRIRSQYLVGYKPPSGLKKGSYRTLTVTLAPALGDKRLVISRPGYAVE